MATTKNIFPFDEAKTTPAGTKLAKNKDPGNFYRRKAKMDADRDMIGDDFKGDGKEILDRLLKKPKKP